MSDLIVGHTWEAIQRAQCGGRLNDRVISGPLVKPIATQADIELLAKHGIDGLREMQFHGVIGRLEESKLV